jgi:hypothetical protein
MGIRNNPATIRDPLNPLIRSSPNVRKSIPIKIHNPPIIWKMENVKIAPSDFNEIESVFQILFQPLDDCDQKISLYMVDSNQKINPKIKNVILIKTSLP